ncbi:MAG: hypothetical protein FWG25_06960, partial [Promicromonosporaceae bacterium]|nr:hypothetical protein [Promicromonosporaceae bacterium]
TLNELHYDWQGNPIQGTAIFNVPSSPVLDSMTMADGRSFNAVIQRMPNGTNVAVVNGQDVPQSFIDHWASADESTAISASTVGQINHIGISNTGFRRLAGFSNENVEWGLSTRLDDSGNWGGTDAMFEHLNSVVGNAPSPVVLHALGDSSPALRQRVAEWNAANGN